MPSQSDVVETDDRPRYRHFFRCKSCGNRFHVDRLTADSSKVKTPKCPRKKCGGKSKESHVPDVGFDPAEGKAPAMTSIHAQAYDQTLKWVTEDQGVTNILDRPNAGESSAPPLEPRLQKLANGFWGGQPREQKTRTARADLSPIYGERATAAQSNAPVLGTRFTADNAPGVAPILTAKPTGSSPIPDHRVVGSYNPGKS